MMLKQNMNLLKLALFSLLLINTYGADNTEEMCALQPSIVATTKENFKDAYLYYYIPLQPVGIYENSILIYNENAEILDCLNQKDIDYQTDHYVDVSYTVSIKYVAQDLFVVNYSDITEADLVAENPIKWIFFDEYFRYRPDLPILEMTPSVESSIFEDYAFINLHDIIVTDDLKYAILLIRVKELITDVKEHLPDATVSEFTFSADGFCVIDMTTNKEIAAMSPDGVYVDYDLWWEYLGGSYTAKLYMDRSEDEEVDILLTVATVNAMNLIDGGHFSPRYENNKVILMNVREQNTAYLMRWDFAQVDPEQESLEIIWALPGYHAPQVIRDVWADKWDFVNDPFHGFSMAHDLNIFNLPKGHMLIHDNGNDHRTSTLAVGRSYSCPMSRSVEYKVEMDVHGKIGHHRITIVFSYPKLEDYPFNVYLENAPAYSSMACKTFWETYNYQNILGSVRKTISNDYIITYYDSDTLKMQTREWSTRMIRLSENGEVMHRWDAYNETTVSYKILPVRADLFRGGMFLENSVIV